MCIISLSGRHPRGHTACRAHGARATPRVDGFPRGLPSEFVSGRNGIGLRAVNHCKIYSVGKVETCHERIAAGCEFSTPV